MEWQPIETAPKDGTVVILCDARPHVGIGIGAFVPEKREVWERIDTETKKLVRVEEHGYWNANNGESICLGQHSITHWQPLPTPPTEG